MFAKYYDNDNEIKPKYSPQVLIGNWYEDRFHPDRNLPAPINIEKDGFRTYDGSRGNLIIIPSKSMHPLDTTLKSTTGAKTDIIKTSTADFQENEEKRMSAKDMFDKRKQIWHEANLLDTNKPTTYNRDYRLWPSGPRWMSEANIVERVDRLGDRTNRQNHSHLAAYLPPVDVPRLVAM